MIFLENNTIPLSISTYIFLSTDFNMKNPRKTFLFEKLYHSLDPKFILPNFISPTDFFIQIFWGRWW